MNKGDILKLNIEKNVFGGEGLGFFDGKAVFVLEGVAGEEVEIELISVKKDYAKGIIKNILKKSIDRVAPPCKVFEMCGGCDYMMLKYEAQLKIKEEIVKEVIVKIGKIYDCKINKVIPMEKPYYYRNKVIQPFGVDNKGKCISGFYKKKTHEIVDNDFCLIQSEISNKILKRIKEIINTYKISIYNEIKHSGLLRNIMIRTNLKNEVMIVIVLNGEVDRKIKNIVEKLTDEFKEIKSVYVSINTKKTNVVLSEKNILLSGEEGIYEEIDEIKFLISPLSFFQVNTEQMKRLYNKALEYIKSKKLPTIVDAYSGTGTIASLLSKKAEKVYAIEVEKEAVKTGKKSLKQNGIKNVEFIEGKVEEKLIELINNGVKIDSIVFDPPRKGLEKNIIEAVSKTNIDKIVYISCNPTTLARDCSIFLENGYEVKEITPVDMFPHTHHVECVALIEKK